MYKALCTINIGDKAFEATFAFKVSIPNFGVDHLIMPFCFLSDAQINELKGKMALVGKQKVYILDLLEKSFVITKVIWASEFVVYLNIQSLDEHNGVELYSMQEI